MDRDLRLVRVLTPNRDGSITLSAEKFWYLGTGIDVTGQSVQLVVPQGGGPVRVAENGVQTA